MRTTIARPARTLLRALSLILALVLGSVPPGRAEPAGAQAPGIALWYGMHQQFGRLGTPQRWLNILGRADAANGGVRLAYRLDRGPERALALGPDARRLAGAGDFNVEIPVRELVATGAPSRHVLEILAYDGAGNVGRSRATFDYDPGQSWPLPHRVKWSEVDDIQHAVQVVDGRWGVTEAGLRTLEPGYDRAVAFGDARWRDIELIAEITLHGIDERGYAPPSNGPGLGFVTRWNGHVPVADEQPGIGVWPSGTLVMYRWRRAWARPRWGMFGNGGATLALDPTGQTLAPGRTYVVAIRVLSAADGQSACGVKVWERHAREPAQWLFFKTVQASAPRAGSILFLAHHVDVTLGEIALRRPASPEPEP